MPYKLRPEAKLKRPARYDNESDDGDFRESSVPRSGNRDSVIDLDGFSPSDTSTAKPSAPESSSFTLDAPQFSQKPPPSKSRNMTDVNNVKKPNGEGAPPESKSARRPNKTARRGPTLLEDEPSPSLSAPGSSAFPSLTGSAPPSPSAAKESTKHGLRELLDAIDNEDHERVRKIKGQFAAKYEAGASPWYDNLKRFWPPTKSHPVLNFENLWPSIRQEIIERIQDDFPPGTYSSAFHPVCRILDVTKEKLDAIMAENARVWPDDEIPPYFREYRERYPKAIIDPDEPPPQAVVEAIAFLKQNSLPGSLLGEWQTMPKVEVFYHPNTFYLPTKKDKSIEPVVPARVLRQPQREHPDTVSSQEAFELLRRTGQDTRKQQNANRRPHPPLQCFVCGHIGHTACGLDENGVHECPQRRQEVSQHMTEIETLRAQASAEISAFKQRDLAMKHTPPNSALSLSGPTDAAPYLEAWQANRANPVQSSHIYQPATPSEDGRTRYINQLHVDNRSHPGRTQNYFASYMSGPATQMLNSHVAGRPMNPPNPSNPPLPLRSQTASASANPPLWPTSTYFAQQQGIQLPQPAPPQAPKKRGPYKKKEKKEEPNKTIPPNRVVSKDGMVFLSSSKQANEEIAFQKQGEGTAATVETGLVTPPPQQDEQPSLLAETGKAGRASAAQKSVAAASTTSNTCIRYNCGIYDGG
ncbi:cytosolic phospholipase A2 [Alternaria panax]|uniref:Cytosolic phospholipase A2 n=1 Tax=Alternaria panax TaxID=48097 RepID=A0AAD4NTE8_9PLEO|nr:cytosolic phospholipase A2 [Alternaria panax]